MFESMGEATRGEHSAEESERRLHLFADRVTQQAGLMGDRRKFKQRQSVDALQGFLDLNLFILNVKKVSCVLFLSTIFLINPCSSHMPIQRRRGRF